MADDDKIESGSLPPPIPEMKLDEAWNILNDLSNEGGLDLPKRAAIVVLMESANEGNRIADALRTQLNEAADRVRGSEREAEDFKRWYREESQKATEANTKMQRAQSDAEMAREGLNRLKLEYHELKQEHDRLVGYVTRVRDGDLPPERRSTDRRQPPRQDYEHVGWTPGKPKWFTF